MNNKEENIFSIFLRHLMMSSAIITVILAIFSGGMQTLPNPFSTWVFLTLVTAIVGTVVKIVSIGKDS